MLAVHCTCLLSVTEAFIDNLLFISQKLQLTRSIVLSLKGSLDLILTPDIDTLHRFVVNQRSEENLGGLSGISASSESMYSVR